MSVSDKNKRVEFAILEKNTLHRTCLEISIKNMFPSAKLYFINALSELNLLRKKANKLSIFIVAVNNEPIEHETVSRYFHPNRVVILSSSPDTDQEHALLELGYDHYYPKNKSTLDKIPFIIRKILASKNHGPHKADHFDALKHNLRLLSKVINNPRLGFKKGQKKWSQLENEMEGLMRKFKNLV